MENRHLAFKPGDVVAHVVRTSEGRLIRGEVTLDDTSMPNLGWTAVCQAIEAECKIPPWSDLEDRALFITDHQAPRNPDIIYP